MLRNIKYIDNKTLLFGVICILLLFAAYKYNILKTVNLYADKNRMHSCVDSIKGVLNNISKKHIDNSVVEQEGTNSSTINFLMNVCEQKDIEILEFKEYYSELTQDYKVKVTKVVVASEYFNILSTLYMLEKKKKSITAVTFKIENDTNNEYRLIANVYIKEVVYES